LRSFFGGFAGASCPPNSRTPIRPGIRKKFGYAHDYHAASAVAAVEVLASAIEVAASIEPERVRDAIPHQNFDSVYGRIGVGDNGQIVMPQTVVQIQNGQIVAIFTERFINEPISPVPPWSSRP
jgi:branched-chain amino acid transport system substrate-binding protein